MVSEIISIGDELLIGQVVNTNASWMASELFSSGITVKRVITVPDEVEDIISALKEGLNRSDLILLSGGLGPTRDDLTKEALCRFFGTSLTVHQPTLRHIRQLFARRGIPVIQKNLDQALVPENATPLKNEHGTAPGLWMEKEGKIIVALPGVPYELKSLITGSVIPKVKEMQKLTGYHHRTILTQGLGESLLSERISRWEDSLPRHIRLAYLPQPGIVRLRVSGSGETREGIVNEVENYARELAGIIPELVFGYDDDTLEGIVGAMLTTSGKTVATAESCTGGYLAHLITSVAGSSVYYRGSVVAYDNSIKEGLLGVRKESLLEHGAVSEVVAGEMAEGVRLKLGTDYALSTTGVAGPGGGSGEKPVGLVFIAFSSREGTIVSRFTFGEHRGRNIRRSALAALNMLRVKLEEGKGDRP